MDAKALLKERIELYNNVFDFKHNKRVPISSHISNWKAFDTGVPLSVLTTDYEAADKMEDELQERYQFDAVSSLWGTGTWTYPVGHVFGNPNYILSENGDAIVCHDIQFIERDEYKELREDPDRLYWTKIFGRSAGTEFTMGHLEKTVEAMLFYSGRSVTLSQDFIDRYGAMFWWKAGIQPPYEQIFSFLRGIKGTSLDLRKCGDEVLETMDVLYERDVKPALLGASAFANDHEGYVAPLSIAMLGHSILNAKQFEKFYWPQMKAIIDFCAEHDMKLLIYCEAEILRFEDYFQEIPKGLALVQLEQDDIFEVRKRIPNIALSGGMPLAVLGHATEQECIDYAKNLIDKLGDGYVFCQDKMACSPNDMKRENLLAVNNFVRNYNY